MQYFLSIAVVVLGSVAVFSQPKRFGFGLDKAQAGFTRVWRDDIYSKEKSFGFEPGAAVECDYDARSKGSCSSTSPFYFSVAVPEGNYRVTVTLGSDNNLSNTTVKAELRRLMLQDVKTKKGEFLTRSFIVNVRTPLISTGGEVKLKDREKTTESWAWDEKLSLEFNGDHPSVNRIEIEPAGVPTIFLLGDSTVCDQPSEPYASWGQMLTRFFNNKIAIANNAESGESLRSSLGAKRLDKVLSLMKPGDYLLIQYSHNDEKEKGEGVGAFTTFKASLKMFVDAARNKGGIPVLITPMHRRTFDADGRVTNSHGNYPAAIRRVAAEEKVALIDLTTMSKDLYEGLGKDGSEQLFKDGDATHHNNYGSFELAKCIVQAIRDQKLELSKYLIKGIAAFDPKRPDLVTSVAVPASPTSTGRKPLGN